MGSKGMLVAREPDFMIHGVLKYELFGQEFWLTTTTVSMTIITLIILASAFAANRAMKKATDVPGMFQNVIELATEMLDKMTVGILNGNAYKFANYIGTIFIFILFNNLSGLLGLRAATADYGVTFLLGMVTFFIVQYQGIKNRRLRHFTSLFEPTPILFPINLIGELAQSNLNLAPFVCKPAFRSYHHGIVVRHDAASCQYRYSSGAARIL